MHSYLQNAVFALLCFALLPCFSNATPYAITGVDGFGTATRYEIRTLIRDYPDQFNLYVLGLQAFQAENEQSKLSYFQIAGIHGLPNIPWDGVQRTNKKGVGYCLHGQNIFPTWHRPYMAAFEQRLQHHAMQIALQFNGTDLERYVAAAKVLRLAYWDWSIKPAPGQPAFPTIYVTQNVSVNTPTGQKTIPNPLYEYRFRPSQTKALQEYRNFPVTARYPQSKDGPKDIHSNNKALEKAVASDRPFNQRALYQWFTNCPRWLEMSDGRPPHFVKKGCSISLESIHGGIHTTVGGFGGKYSGDMADLYVAAFDPIFWAHHTNVDRLIAMWQAAYPGQYVDKEKIHYPTFTLNKGQLIDRHSPLAPFHRNEEGLFWTSSTARNFTVFQYTYPEFLNGGGTPAAMRKQINKLYGAHATEHPAEEVASEETKIDAPRMDSADSSRVANNGSSYQYIANVVTTRYGLGGSYSIVFFLGDPASEDTSTWLTDPNFAGNFGVFSAPGMENMNSTSLSAITLTDPLIARVASGALQDLTEASVVPYLEDNLQWKVAGPGGVQVDPANVQDFSVEVVASTRSPLTDLTEFPLWSQFVALSQVTSGKPGGLSE